MLSGTPEELAKHPEVIRRVRESQQQKKLNSYMKYLEAEVDKNNDIPLICGIKYDKYTKKALVGALLLLEKRQKMC